MGERSLLPAQARDLSPLSLKTLFPTMAKFYFLKMMEVKNKE
jgi:hypothetical protein